MKRILSGIFVGLLLGGAVTWTLLKRSGADKEKEGTKNEEPKEASHVQRGTNGETFLRLDKEAQQHAGVKVAALESLQLQAELKGYGRVLDPAPLAALLVESSSARASLDASTREYQRLKTLFAQDQNVSARALEASEAAMKRDQILMDSAQARLVLNWGRAIAEQKDLPALVHSLVTLESALARIDLPLGEAAKAAPNGGRLAPVAAEDSPMEAQFLGRVTSVDAQMQGQGFLFLLKSNSLPAGAAMIGWLKIPGEPKTGVVVPRAALIRHEGEVFVYLQTGDDAFRRTEVELGRPVEKGWFVEEGLKSGDRVVVVGAQQLLSEELKGPGEE